MKNDIQVNSVYEANLKALWECYPKIAERVEQAPVSLNFEICGTGQNRYVNVFSLQHRFFFYDQENPFQDAADQLSQLNLKNTKIAVFLGFGLGYEVQYFAREMASDLGTIKILIIEKDLELFKTALNMFDYAPMMYDRNIKLVVGEKEEDLFPVFSEFFMERVNVNYLKAMKPVYHMSSLKLHKDYYLKALQVLTESGVYSVNYYGNSPEDSLIGVENMLDNTNEIVSNPGINLLYDKFAGKPAVVVATGPSLNKNRHLLKGLEEKALIISADASLRILINMGIKPHLVTSLERIEPVVKLLAEFSPEQVEDVYLAACPVILSEAYRVYPGPRIIVYRNFDHFRWLGVDKGILDIKQSAGNMAFKLAEALGCNPIILIGQDLAYSREGKTHARGTLFGENQPLPTNEQFEVMGNDGEPIMTNRAWNEFRKAYEIDVAKFPGKCLNCTEGGAYIHGTEVTTFQDAIDRYIIKDFHPLKIIKENLKGFSGDTIREDVEKVKAVIQATKNDLIKMKEYCKQAMAIIEENGSLLQAIIEDSALPEKNYNLDEIHSDIIKLKTRIMSLQPTIQLFLMHIIQSYHIKFHIDLNELPDLYEGEDLLQAHRILRHTMWFGVIHDIIIVCETSLDKAEASIDELAASL